MSSRIEARVSQHLKATSERVYDAWLDPGKARVWMAASLTSWGLAGDIRRVEIDARVGGKFFFSDMRDGIEARHCGSYLELDPPQKIVFTWITDESEDADPSVVTIMGTSRSSGNDVLTLHNATAAFGRATTCSAAEYNLDF
jgi:uncharacterized protein YndB with AHSA1/START domain